MALIFPNSVCPLCNELLGEDIIAFPRMIENSADELLFADDSAFHRICIERHPLYERLMCRLKLWDEALAANLASHHECLLCKKTIVDPDDCYNFGFFSYGARHPLFGLNYRECHENCLRPGNFPSAILAELQSLPDSPEISPSKRADLLERLGASFSIRPCVVCGEQVTSPDDCFRIGRLTDRPDHLLCELNDQVCHRSCLTNRAFFDRFFTELQKQAWRNRHAKQLLTAIQSVRKEEAKP